MSNKPKSRRKFFNIDKEAKKYYPTLKCQGVLTPLPVYVPQRISKFQVAYKQMAA